MSTPDQPATEAAAESAADEPVPHVALSTVRGRPPAKVFATKSLAQRSLMSDTKGSLLERLHGPMVKWPRNGTRKPGAAANVRVVAQTPDPGPERRGENMSERFISERLLSDRGPTFNPQIPRRVPDIPSPASVKASEADTEGKRLTVGRQVKLTGEIGGCEKLMVEGVVEAVLHEIKVLEIGTSGTFKGTAEVESATVAGSFEGTLRVSGHLDIGAGATVKGTVSYGTITIASGGKLLGTVEST
jgi:cytoskeletal protein CcmA (bactofilin family)